MRESVVPRRIKAGGNSDMMSIKATVAQHAVVDVIGPLTYRASRCKCERSEATPPSGNCRGVPLFGTPHNDFLLLAFTSIVAVVALLVTTAKAWGQAKEDLSANDIPIFPNVLIILDTSGSMAEVPYRTKNGDPVPVGTRPWKMDVMIDEHGEPAYDGEGNLRWIPITRSVAEDRFAASVDPDVLLTGGNHPASKFYKAKLALNRVLPEIDSVNLGFATFMQLRSPRVKALYYRASSDRYEFRWILTPGIWNTDSAINPGYINTDTCCVIPFDSISPDDRYVISDKTMLPPDNDPWDKAEEIRCSPIPLTYETIPKLPETPTVLGAKDKPWKLVTTVMPDKVLADGTVVTAYPKAFDYSLIWYPNRPDTTGPRHLHSWSYVHMVKSGTDWADMQWQESVPKGPYYPKDAENPDKNNLGEEFVLDSDRPELSNYSGDDHLFFVHLPDPDHDDDSETVKKHRDQILRCISLDRADDPTYDCYVTEGGFCPHGAAGPDAATTYRQFTCMPFTDSIACGGYTALATSLRKAKKYYLSFFDQDERSQDGCRENCVILFTDGRENCERHEDVIAAAKGLYDLVWHEGRDDARKIPVRTYVIGFGLDDGGKKRASEIAAAGGTEMAYFATSVDEVVTALRKILGAGAELGGLYTGSDPVIVGNDAIYTAYFQFPSWKGHLKKYSLVEDWWRQGPEGWYAEDLSWHDSGVRGKSGDSLDGDAGARLSERGASSRVIYTADYTKNDNKLIAFTESNASVADSPLVSAGLIAPGFGSPAELVAMIRDMNFVNSESGDVNREVWKLGDIYHSTPVVVREALQEELRRAQAGRTHLVIAGANDGMVHAFDDSDGTELWAYIPQCILGNLHELKDGHTYCVDLDLKVADVLLHNEWRTILVGGLRQGGHHYFALDITDTADPAPLWEVTHEVLGQTWSVPSLGRIPGDKYVAFVGGGQDPRKNVGNSFYIIDLENGDFIKEYYTLGESDEDFPAQVRAVDLNRDGYVERVYIVSTKGKLYRLNIDADEGIDDEVVMIFDPGEYAYDALEKIKGVENEVSATRIVPTGASLPVDVKTMRRPAYYAPAVMRTRYFPHNYLIHYGTGDEKAVLSEDTEDFFFEIEDRGPENPFEQEARCRWVYVFEKGEKCLSRPVTFDYVVYFTTFAPTHACGGGAGYVYGISTSSRLETHGDAALGCGLDGTFLKKKKYRVGGPDEIKGIPSSPQVVNGAVVGNSSRNPLDLWKLTINELRTRVRSWQEIF